jgi:single-stranded-DNA-specific exonuclease
MGTTSEMARAEHLLRASLRDNGKVALVYHADADGIASAALLARVLEEAGTPVATLTPEKAQSVYDPVFEARMRELAATLSVVLDTGARAGWGPRVGRVIVIDHHALEGAPQVDCFLHDASAPATTTLVYELASRFAKLEHHAWLVALGLLGDAGEKAKNHPLVRAASARFGGKALREVVALVNASGRASRPAPERALSALRGCDDPRRIARGEGEDAQVLLELRTEVASAIARARRVAPRVRGRWAIIELHEGCRVHGVIASAWARRLAPRLVLVANRGYSSGRVHLSVRSHEPLDLREALRSLLPDEGSDYAAGHARASGAILPVASYERLLAAIEREATTQPRSASQASP